MHAAGRGGMGGKSEPQTTPTDVAPVLKICLNKARAASDDSNLPNGDLTEEPTKTPSDSCESSGLTKTETLWNRLAPELTAPLILLSMKKRLNTDLATRQWRFRRMDTTRLWKWTPRRQPNPTLTWVCCTGLPQQNLEPPLLRHRPDPRGDSVTAR